MDDIKNDLSGQDKLLVDKLNPKYFFFELPLYEKISINNEEDIGRLKNILSFRGQFDAYHYIIKENSTFEGHYSNPQEYNLRLDEEFSAHTIRLRCKRTENLFVFYVIANKSEMEKVGQFPSLADLNIGHIKEYRHVLSQEKLREFVRGIGLHAHGVGIGSFVYLRRIFEHLIEQEHLIAMKKDDWDHDLYQKSRMSEKIDMLQDWLPVFLTQNKDLYSILSLGIHELSEEECLRYFDILKMGIQEILDEKVIERQRIDRKEKVKKSLDDIRRTIRNK